MSTFFPQDNVNRSDYHLARLVNDHGFTHQEARQIQLMQRENRRLLAVGRVQRRVTVPAEQAPHQLPHRKYRVVGSSAVTQGRGEYADPARIATRSTHLERVEEHKEATLAHVARELFGARA